MLLQTSNLPKDYKVIAELMDNNKLEIMGKQAWSLLQSKYIVDYSYQSIINRIN